MYIHFNRNNQRRLLVHVLTMISLKPGFSGDKAPQLVSRAF
jgi:hypothetical protein